jgi:hypothetical protein
MTMGEHAEYNIKDELLLHATYDTWQAAAMDMLSARSAVSSLAGQPSNTTAHTVSPSTTSSRLSLLTGDHGERSMST